MTTKTIDKRELRRLCWAFIQEATEQLVAVGAWPRPRRARRLKRGHDLFYPDVVYTHAFRELERWAEAHKDILRRRGMHSITDATVHLLVETLSRGTTDVPERTDFVAEFELFWKALSQRTRWERRIVTLAGLELARDVQRIVLEQGLKLLPLPDGQTFAQRWLAAQFYEYEDLNFEYDTHSAIVTDRRYRFDDLGNRWPLPWREEDRSSNLISAILIHCPGIVRTARHYMLEPATFPIRTAISYSSDGFDRGTLGWYERPCLISRADVPRIRRIERLLYTHARRIASLDIAVGRFISSYRTESSWLQRIVDLTIALEALAGPRDPGELTQRLRMRLPFLLGGTGLTSSQDIFRLVGILYDIRSRVLHGTSPSEKQKAKWIEMLAGKPTSGARTDEMEEMERAVKVARQVVRRTIVGVLGLLESTSSAIQYPLPDNFEELMTAPGAQARWARSFRRQLQEDLPYFGGLMSYDDRRKAAAAR